MFTVLVILTVKVAVLMILIVLVQKSKGGGLSSQFGGGNQVLGVRGTNSFLEKTTWTLAVLILVLSVACAYAMPDKVAANATRADLKDVAAAPAPVQANQFDTKAPAAEAATPAAAPAAEAAPAENSGK